MQNDLIRPNCNSLLYWGLDELSILKFKEKMFPHFQFADAEMTKLERYPGKGIFKFLDKKTNLFKKNNYLPDWKYKKTK